MRLRRDRGAATTTTTTTSELIPSLKKTTNHVLFEGILSTTSPVKAATYSFIIPAFIGSQHPANGVPLPPMRPAGAVADVMAHCARTDVGKGRC